MSEFECYKKFGSVTLKWLYQNNMFHNRFKKSDLDISLIYKYIQYGEDINSDNIIFDRVNNLKSTGYNHPNDIYLYNSREKIKKGMITNEKSIFYIGPKYNTKIEDGAIPEGIKKLFFRNSEIDYAYEPTYDYPMDEGTLPNSLEDLNFGNSPFNCILLEGIFKNRLLRLVLSKHFNQTILPNVLPESLLYLDLGMNNSKALQESVLPSKLEFLKIGFRYNTELKRNILPNSLKELVIYNDYMVFEEGSLPDSLEILFMLRNHTNRGITRGILPQGLKILIIRTFKGIIEEGALPDSLKLFYIDNWDTNEIFHLQSGIIPSSVKLLSLSYVGMFNNIVLTENSIPHSVIKLQLGLMKINYENNILIQNGYIPNQVKYLYCSSSHNVLLYEQGSIPDTIEYIDTGYYSLDRFFEMLPENLIGLRLGYLSLYNDTIQLPIGLKYLVIKSRGNRFKKLPPNLEQLIMENEKIDYNILDNLHTNIKYIQWKEEVSNPNSMNKELNIWMNGKIYHRIEKYSKIINKFKEADFFNIYNIDKKLIKKEYLKELLFYKKKPENIMKYIQEGNSIEDSLSYCGYSI